MGCGTLMNKFGFRWPDYLDCTRLPEKDCLTLDTTDNEYQLNMDNNTHFLGNEVYIQALRKTIEGY